MAPSTWNLKWVTHPAANYTRRNLGAKCKSPAISQLNKPWRNDLLASQASPGLLKCVCAWAGVCVCVCNFKSSCTNADCLSRWRSSQSGLASQRWGGTSHCLKAHFDFPLKETKGNFEILTAETNDQYRHSDSLASKQINYYVNLKHTCLIIPSTNVGSRSTLNARHEVNEYLDEALKLTEGSESKEKKRAAGHFGLAIFQFSCHSSAHQ